MGSALAWRSDGCKRIDHIDTLMPVFDGIRRAGHPVAGHQRIPRATRLYRPLTTPPTEVSHDPKIKSGIIPNGPAFHASR
jgi:hypothetical protein